MDHHNHSNDLPASPTPGVQQDQRISLIDLAPTFIKLHDKIPVDISEYIPRDKKIEYELDGSSELVDRQSFKEGYNWMVDDLADDGIGSEIFYSWIDCAQRTIHIRMLLLDDKGRRCGEKLCDYHFDAQGLLSSIKHEFKA